MEFWFSEFHTPDVKHSIRVSKQLYSKQSDYQRIDIFETPEFGRVLTLDGNVMLTERDEFIYDEMIVHVPMAVHKEAKDILVIGAPSIIFITHFDERFDEFRRLFPAQDAAVDQQVAVVTVAAISAGDVFIPAMEGIVIIPDDFCRMAFG